MTWQSVEHVDDIQISCPLRGTLENNFFIANPGRDAPPEDISTELIKLSSTNFLRNYGKKKLEPLTVSNKDASLNVIRYVSAHFHKGKLYRIPLESFPQMFTTFNEGK